MGNRSGSECRERKRLHYTASLCIFDVFWRRKKRVGEKKNEKKKTKKKKKNVHVPGGPRIVLTHSYKLSPFGPALQFVGGSKLISASSFWMRFAAELIPALLIFSF